MEPFVGYHPVAGILSLRRDNLLPHLLHPAHSSLRQLLHPRYSFTRQVKPPAPAPSPSLLCH